MTDGMPNMTGVPVGDKLGITPAETDASPNIAPVRLQFHACAAVRYEADREKSTAALWDRIEGALSGIPGVFVDVVSAMPMYPSDVVADSPLDLYLKAHHAQYGYNDTDDSFENVPGSGVKPDAR